MPWRSSLSLIVLSLCGWAATNGSGQTVLPRAESERVESFFASTRSGPHLGCSIQPRRPFLDFSFRFDVAYLFSCPLRDFGGRDATVLAYTRVTPHGGKPLTLAASYHLPGITSQDASTLNRRLKGRVVSSGGFAAGEGRYEVQVLLLDRETGRGYQKRWRVRVARDRGQRAVPAALAPGNVLPIAFRPWQGKLDSSGKGLRVAVWLNATAMNRRSPRLRVWDRAFLLDSLSSLLTRVPCASVRLVAFNLDQQQVVYQQENFDRQGFMHLDEALQRLELGTVSYRVLQHGRGWMDLLLELANREVTAQDPSDVVIILSPRIRYYDAVSRETLKARETTKPRFCYFQFFPRPGYPDAIQNLTRRLDGNVYSVYSPGEFAHAIDKMLAPSRGPQSSPAAGP